MNRNSLYLLIGALAVVVIALGIQLSHERAEPGGINIELKDNGISVVEKK